MMNNHREIMHRAIGVLAACATLMIGQAVFAADSGDEAPVPQCGGETKPVEDAKPKPKPKPVPVPQPASVASDDAIPLCGGETKPVEDAKPKPKPKPLPVPQPA